MRPAQRQRGKRPWACRSKIRADAHRAGFAAWMPKQGEAHAAKRKARQHTYRIFDHCKAGSRDAAAARDAYLRYKKNGGPQGAASFSNFMPSKFPESFPLLR